MKIQVRNICLLLLNHLDLEKLRYQNHLNHQPSTELVVSLIVNNEEQLLRALADTCTSSSIILEAYTSAPFIKTDDNNTTTWSTMSDKFTMTKTGFVTFSLPEFNLKKQMCSSWEFHIDDRSESSRT
jgi:hypothetical protein